MKIGCIRKYDLRLNPHLTGKFKFIEVNGIRRIGARSDRVYSKMMSCPVDYDEVLSNTQFMKNNPTLILVQEPFFVDDELRDRVTKWVEWANQAGPKEYYSFV